MVLQCTPNSVTPSHKPLFQDTTISRKLSEQRHLLAAVAQHAKLIAPVIVSAWLSEISLKLHAAEHLKSHYHFALSPYHLSQSQTLYDKLSDQKETSQLHLSQDKAVNHAFHYLLYLEMLPIIKSRKMKKVIKDTVSGKYSFASQSRKPDRAVIESHHPHDFYFAYDSQCANTALSEFAHPDSSVNQSTNYKLPDGSTMVKHGEKTHYQKCLCPDDSDTYRFYHQRHMLSIKYQDTWNLDAARQSNQKLCWPRIFKC